MRFYFKVVYTSITKELDIDRSMSVSDFILNMNETWRSYFNIHEHYHIQIVATGNKINGDCELAPPIEATYETVGERFNSRNVAFYLRPVHPITEEFIRRDDYSVAPNYTQPTTPDSTIETGAAMTYLNNDYNLEQY